MLDSIFWALCGKEGIQSQPIRKGAEKAKIRLNLGEIVVERRFTPNGTTLIVENTDGARYPSPQSMLDDLIGELSFDPLAFTNMEPKKQYQELRRIAKIEVDLEKLEAANKADYEQRREKNRQAKELQIRATGYQFQFPTIDKAIDLKALTDKLQSAAQHNANIESEKNSRAVQADMIKFRKEKIVQLEEELARLRSELQNMEDALTNAEPLPDPIDVTELRRQLDEWQEKNKEFERRQEQTELLAQAKALEAESEALTKAMEERDAQKAKALQDAKMPVPGLSLSEGRVFLNGVPFDQCSSAEQLRASVAIAMAANPKLRVIRIKEGSLLDDDGLKMIAEMTKERDYQVWMERVDSTGKIGIVMEDGTVKAVNDAT